MAPPEEFEALLVGQANLRFLYWLRQVVGLATNVRLSSLLQQVSQSRVLASQRPNTD